LAAVASTADIGYQLFHRSSDRYTANLSGYLGHKTLDEGDWQSLDSQTAIGVLFDIRKQSWPVSIVYNVVGSGDVDKSGSLETEGYTLEHRIGIRKTYDSEKIHRYYGGGIALVEAEIKNKDNGITTSEDDDSATGYWLGAGLYYDVTSQFILGFDVTYTNADKLNHHNFLVCSKHGSIYRFTFFQPQANRIPLIDDYTLHHVLSIHLTDLLSTTINCDIPCRAIIMYIEKLFFPIINR